MSEQTDPTSETTHLNDIIEIMKAQVRELAIREEILNRNMVLDNPIIKDLVRAASALTGFYYNDEMGYCMNCGFNEIGMKYNTSAEDEAAFHESDCDTVVLRNAIERFYKYRGDDGQNTKETTLAEGATMYVQDGHEIPEEKTD